MKVGRGTAGFAFKTLFHVQNDQTNIGPKFQSLRCLLHWILQEHPLTIFVRFLGDVAIVVQEMFAEEVADHLVQPPLLSQQQRFLFQMVLLRCSLHLGLVPLNQRNVIRIIIGFVFRLLFL